MNISSETISLASSTTTEPSHLSTTISTTSPRYSFYRYSSPSTPAAIVFIYTCPSGSKIKERMLYASSRAAVVAIAEKEAGLSVAKKMEASGPDELTEAVLEEEFKPRVEVKRAFERPKRPGRR